LENRGKPGTDEPGKTGGKPGTDGTFSDIFVHPWLASLVWLR
jgi:hypothetical protein